VAGVRFGHIAAELSFLGSFPDPFALCATERLMVIAININYELTGKGIIKEEMNYNSDPPSRFLNRLTKLYL